MKVNKWYFWIIFILYSIVSIASFVFTSGGWIAFVYILPDTVLVFGIISFVLLISNLVLKNKKEVFLPKDLLYFLIIIQVLTVAFNFGDCGDGSGSFQFFQTLMGANGWGLCNTGREAPLPVITPILYFGYLLVLLVFLGRSYQSSPQSQKISGI